MILYKQSCLFNSMLYIASKDNNKLVNELIDENIVESVSSVLTEKEDKSTQVYNYIIKYYYYF